MSTNPFDDDVPDRGAIDPFATGKQHRKAKTSANPYDFEVNFEKGNRRKTMSGDREPIITGMDATGPLRKPSVMQAHHRASTIGADVQRFTAFLGKGMQGTGSATAEMMRNVGGGGSVIIGGATDKRGEGTLYIGKNKRMLARWPYDDYHMVQKMFYEKLEELETNGNTEKNGADNNSNNMSSIPIFSRPQDPPDVRHAVVGLPLTDFEQKAEERGIAIVSTWLFDAGLIDELLVNGGMGPSVLEGNATGDAAATEGVEVGAMGHPIEGSNKMDKEIAKLRSATKRHLTLINARLNDGVAASGSEVQELVNAVNSTKDDLGRLRELSTYISNAGDVEKTNNFMLRNYPHLKGGVNARRNLTRCFRELGFFSQIPDTCERLREQLYAGEYTAHEWTNLRNVCREHVELEVFLVEAEVGMKQRLLEEGEYKTGDGSIKPPSIQKPGNPKNKSYFGRQAFRDMGLDHNNSEVDRFLKEHVKNVWELGDEIRIRLLSGIGSAFDLSMNNPQGMVALVEAVEVYETAAEEYKAVHGVESGSIQNLRFTDMRSAALSSLFKDMEVRGMDVFKDLTMQVRFFASS